MWKDADKPDQSQMLLVDLPNVTKSDLTAQEKQDLIDLPDLSELEIKAINRRFEPYIFFKKSKKEDYECFCSRCNTTFYASAKKRGDFENCPTCGKEALIVSASYQQKSKNQSINFIVFKKHKITDTVYALCLEVNKIYSRRQYGCRYFHVTPDINFERQPDLKAWVKKIYVFKPGKVDTYMPYYSGRIGQLVYSKVRKRITKPFAGKMYHEAEKEYLNEDLLVQTHLKYYYRASPSDSRLVEWLCICSLYPIAEIAARSQLRIAKDIIMDKLRGESSHQNLVNWRAKSPKNFFKIPFNDVKEFDEISFVRNIEVLERYAVHYARGEKVSFELCDFENNLLLYKYRIKDNFDFFIKDIDAIKKLYAYQHRQDKINKWYSLNHYFDYLDAAKECSYDLTQDSVLFPRDIRKAHDDAIDNRQILREEKLKEAARKEAEKYNYPQRYRELCKKYSFEYGNLMIVVPEHAADIITEGRNLCHCVAGYASRHIRGTTTILFLRHKNETKKSYYTIEVNEQCREIRQCHGYRNEQENDKAAEVVEFEKEFAKYIKNPKTYKAERKEEPCRKKSA